MEVLSLSGLLDLGDGFELEMDFLSIFALVCLENPDSVVGHADGVFGVHEGLEGSEVGVLVGLLDERVIIEGIIVFHLEYYKIRRTSPLYQSQQSSSGPYHYHP